LLLLRHTLGLLCSTVVVVVVVVVVVLLVVVIVVAGMPRSATIIVSTEGTLWAMVSDSLSLEIALFAYVYSSVLIIAICEDLYFTR